MSADLPGPQVTAEQGWREPVVGVMGGLGPLATATFLRFLAALTPAERDQDHLDLVVLSHATTPDRTARILDAARPDPTPVMAADARRLQQLGVAFVVMPCNTGHWFLHEVEGGLEVPVLSIVDATVQAAIARAGAAGRGSARVRVGVLATDGTRAAGVYDRALEAAGAQAVLPDEADQAAVMRVIYEQVKAGRPVDLPAFLGVVDRLAQRCEVVVLGCTELSVVYDEHALAGDRRLVDSLDSLARATLRRAGREPLSGS